MVRRISHLTDDERARLDAHAGRWIALGLRTGEADRERFEAAMRRCHAWAGLPWHGRVIWLSSPLQLVLTAALLYPHSQEWPPSLAIETVLPGEAAAELASALAAVPHACAWRPAARVLERAAAAPVDAAINRAIDVTVSDTVERAVSRTAGDVVESLVEGAAGEALDAFALAPDSDPRWRGRLINLLLVGQLWGKGGVWGPASTSFFREVCGLTLDGDLWDRARAREDAAQSAWWCLPHQDFLLACGPPQEIHLEPTNIVDVRGRRSQRLHHLEGPAIRWPDGWGLHAIHGRRVPARMIEHPETISVRDIEDERNAEVRHVMIDRYGWSRYIRDCGAEIVEVLPMDYEVEGLRGARLLRKFLPGELDPVVYLEMVNSTPEADGTHRRYLERIDPNAYGGDAARFCHAAMASRWQHRDESGRLRLTFADWRDYRPLSES